MKAVFEKHVVLIVVWALIALAFSHIYPPLAMLLFVGLVGFIFYPRRDILALMLAVSVSTQALGQVILSPPAKEPPPDDPHFVICIEALIVIVVGVIVIDEYVKYCNGQIAMPPVPTNNIPTNAIPTNGLPSKPFPSVFMLTNSGPPMGQRSFSMNVNMAPDGALALSPITANAYWDQSWNTLTYGQWTNAFFTGWGVVPTTTTVSSPQPPAPGSNLQASYTGGILSVTEAGQPTRTIVLYRSADCVNWSAISTNVWSARFTQVMAVDSDAPEQAAFYKVQ